MLATTTLSFSSSPLSPAEPLVFATIDGYLLSRKEGEAALHEGRAVLVGDLSVVLFTALHPLPTLAV